MFSFFLLHLKSKDLSVWLPDSTWSGLSSQWYAFWSWQAEHSSNEAFYLLSSLCLNTLGICAGMVPGHPGFIKHRQRRVMAITWGVWRPGLLSPASPLPGCVAVWKLLGSSFLTCNKMTAGAGGIVQRKTACLSWCETVSLISRTIK